ncbi:MAG: hypothetical protein IPM56_14495 [Ignavibacteriales bacterium]|nr:MAG: hypothetical protein IPM56_14495 [Ignavibacteriales bacterium]
MSNQNHNKIIKWLLEGDVSVQYQVYRDLLGTDKKSLREKISKEGWGKKFLSLRNSNGHWGAGFYQPKWISSHYTLVDLKYLNVSPANKIIKETISKIISENTGRDGGVNPSHHMANSDICVNGMFLNYASYFKTKEEKLKPVVDLLLDQQMGDGGFNCHSNRSGATHSSMHTTISVLEGILEYTNNKYSYRINELEKAATEAEEFLLLHKLFRSHRTGEVIKKQMLMLSFPSRWYYDILRCLEYFYRANIPYDERMKESLEIIQNKQRADGSWSIQSKHPGIVHFEMEPAGKPSRWNTLRAMRVLNFYNIDYIRL